MDLQQLKEQLNKIGFSPESLSVMNKILDDAITGGGISKAEKERLLAIIDLEIESSDLLADTLDEVAFSLDNYATSSNRVFELSKEEEEEIVEDSNKQLDELEKQADQLTQQASTGA